MLTYRIETETIVNCKAHVTIYHTQIRYQHRHYTQPRAYEKILTIYNAKCDQEG